MLCKPIELALLYFLNMFFSPVDPVAHCARDKRLLHSRVEIPVDYADELVSEARHEHTKATSSYWSSQTQIAKLRKIYKKF